MLKAVFFGSSKFVIPIIEVLRKNFDLTLVVTTEKPKHNLALQGETLQAYPVIKYCSGNKIPYLSVSNLSDPKFKVQSSKFKVSIGILASFGAIIPNEVLNLFPHGIFNIHPSLLPKYRGPTPVQTAILNGDRKTGVTIIKLDELVDHGPILAQVEEPISENDTAEFLYERLFKLGASSIVDTIELYLKGKIIPFEQDHSRATFTKKLARDDGYVDISNLNSFDKFRVDAERSRSIKTQISKLLNRMIRAYHPWPGAWTKFRTQNSELRIKFLPEKKIQVEGKKPMSYKDFTNGYPKIGKEILTKLGLLDNNK